MDPRMMMAQKLMQGGGAGAPPQAMPQQSPIAPPASPDAPMTRDQAIQFLQQLGITESAFPVVMKAVMAIAQQQPQQQQPTQQPPPA